MIYIIVRCYPTPSTFTYTWISGGDIYIYIKVKLQFSKFPTEYKHTNIISTIIILYTLYIRNVVQQNDVPAETEHNVS